MESDRWIEKGDFRSETKSGFIMQSKKSLCNPKRFDRAIRSVNPVENSTFSTGCADRIARSEKFLKPTASLSTPPPNTRSHHTTAYISSDAGLAATAAAAVGAHSESACTSFSPPASTMYSLPMVAVRSALLSMTFLPVQLAAATAVLALAILDEV